MRLFYQDHSFHSSQLRSVTDSEQQVDSSEHESAEYTIEDTLKALYGTGNHQKIIQIVGVLTYALGSQMLNMMPFMQLYPALKC